MDIKYAILVINNDDNTKQRFIIPALNESSAINQAFKQVHREVVCIDVATEDNKRKYGTDGCTVIICRTDNENNVNTYLVTYTLKGIVQG